MATSSSNSTQEGASIKLSGKSNYQAWQEWMWDEVSNLGKVGYIDGTEKVPKRTYRAKTRAGDRAFMAMYAEWEKADNQVRKLILGSLDKEVKKIVVGLQTANDVWNQLKATYHTDTIYNEKSENYAYPYQVNAASFVSIKLSGRSNYVGWRKQMMCLVNSQNMNVFINGESEELMNGSINGKSEEPKTNAGVDINSKSKGPKTDDSVDINSKSKKYLEWKRSDALMQGWIYGSLNAHVMETVVDLNTAHDVWNELERNYGTATDPIPSGDTALRSAIRNHEDVKLPLENILNKPEIGTLQTLANDLCYAIVCGNKEVVQTLVEKKKELLFIEAKHDFPVKENEGNENKVKENEVQEKEDLPLIAAAIYCQEEIFLSLLEKSRENTNQFTRNNVEHKLINPFEGDTWFKLLTCTITAGFYNEAYDLIIEKFPRFPTEEPTTPANPLDVKEALCSLAKKPDGFLSTKQYNFCQDFIYKRLDVKKCNKTHNIPDIENNHTSTTNLVTWKSYFYHVLPYIKDLHEEKVKHNRYLHILKFICKTASTIPDTDNDYENVYKKALILAVKSNIYEIIKEITQKFPQSIRNTKENDCTLYQLSIKNRCENAYKRLVCDMPYHKDLHHLYSSYPKDNLLHLAGKLASQDKLNTVTGAALQMQRELQWFKKVEDLVPVSEKEAKNEEGKTPIMVFKKEHQVLREEGEKWMRSTAKSYTITAALIITIVFAAAITVPGGNNDVTGKTIYKTKPSFIVFIISDGISLFTSTTSLLFFLSILTARYAEEDFLTKLPMSLIFGLVMLFVSVTTMLIAFGAALFITSGQQNFWILIPICVVTSMTIALFLILQLPLLYDLCSSTRGRGIFSK